MTRPHVVVLMTLGRLGGAERSLLELVDRLRDAFRFTLILPEEGPLGPAACAAGASVEIVPWPPALATAGERAGRAGLARLARAGAAAPRVVRELRRALATLAPDVLLTNGIKAHALGALAHDPARGALVWYAREGLEDRRLSRWLLRRLGDRPDGAVAISRYVAGELRPLLPLRAPVHVLPNIVDPHVFRPGLAPAADLPRASGEVRFGMVGALTPLKGQDVFLEAAARVARALPAARFVVVGGVPYRTEARLGFDATLRDRTLALGLGDRVAFLGERDDVPRIMAGLDVLVQPNRGPEGLGRSVLEAMASGLAVVAVDRWGLRELVRDEETGLLTPHLDVAALAARMERLGREAELRARLGRAARAWVVAHGDPERLAGAFRSALRGFVARHVPAGAPAPARTASAAPRRRAPGA